MPAHSRTHYAGDYRQRAATIRTTANANPNTRCWRCGRTLAEHPPHHNGDPPTWHAGHTKDSDSNAALAAEASTCNTSAGASYGNRMREPHSRNW